MAVKMPLFSLSGFTLPSRRLLCPKFTRIFFFTVLSSSSLASSASLAYTSLSSSLAPVAPVALLTLVDLALPAFFFPGTTSPASLSFRPSFGVCTAHGYALGDRGGGRNAMAVPVEQQPHEAVEAEDTAASG